MRRGDGVQDAATALKCELAGEVLRSSGKLRLGVTGWSMLPTIWPGDTLLIESAGYEAVSEGDIVLYGRDSRVVAHRLIAKVRGREKEDEQFITRGDGMSQPDPPESASRLLGKVVLVVRNGRGFEPGNGRGIAARAISALVGRSVLATRVLAYGYRLARTQTKAAPVKSGFSCQA